MLAMSLHADCQMGLQQCTKDEKRDRWPNSFFRASNWSLPMHLLVFTYAFICKLQCCTRQTVVESVQFPFIRPLATTGLSFKLGNKCRPWGVARWVAIKNFHFRWSWWGTRKLSTPFFSVSGTLGLALFNIGWIFFWFLSFVNIPGGMYYRNLFSQSMAGDSQGSVFTSVTTDITGDTTVLGATGFASVAGGGPVSGSFCNIPTREVIVAFIIATCLESLLIASECWSVLSDNLAVVSFAALNFSCHFDSMDWNVSLKEVWHLATSPCTKAPIPSNCSLKYSPVIGWIGLEIFAFVPPIAPLTKSGGISREIIPFSTFSCHSATVNLTSAKSLTVTGGLVPIRASFL